MTGRMRRPLLVPFLVLCCSALLAMACSGDDDAPEEGGDGDRTASTAPDGEGNAPEAPDLDQELATAVSADGTMELVVNDLRQDGDQLTVWVTLTNESEDKVNLLGDFTDPDLGAVTQNKRADVSGLYLVDWAAKKAYYPMVSDQGHCACSRVGGFGLEEGGSLAIFATYNGIDELTEASLILPGFLPADGLAPG